MGNPALESFRFPPAVLGDEFHWVSVSRSCSGSVANLLHIGAGQVLTCEGFLELDSGL